MTSHDKRRSKNRRGGSVIPQAHPTGYPLYRLEWQAVGSLQRRLRNCMIGVRAEPSLSTHRSSSTWSSI